MKDGWYWVSLKYTGHYEVALYERGRWYRAGILQDRTADDHSFAEIGPRILSPKDHHLMTAGEIADQNRLTSEWFITRQREDASK